ncbi:MAG: ankyrin repeat domain-containing protein [Alphaproteobacteria bacterium]|nr:ankyrin repeat domain-containing protein [Alphaproteobacteria bacterium]
MKLGIRSWIGSCSLLALLYISDAGATDYMSNTEGANHLGRSSQVSSSYRSIDASSREENNANERQRAITNDEKKQLKKLFDAKDFDLEKIENFLKDKGIDFGLNKTKGSEEIIDAAWLGNPDLVRLLMNYGADINNAEYPLFDGSPLHVAVVFFRNRVAMRCLVECGADVKNCDRNKDSIIRTMIQRWQNAFGKEDIEFMVNHGMDVNQMYNIHGNLEIPLIWAIELDKGEDLIKCLIDNGADINKVDSEGKTALMVASSNGCFKTVKLLLNMKNVENTIFLLTAYKNKHPLRTEQIVSRTKTLVNINARNKRGRTALDFAQKNLRSAEKIKQTQETIEGIKKTCNILLRHGAKTKDEINKDEINLELRDIYFNDAVRILS